MGKIIILAISAHAKKNSPFITKDPTDPSWWYSAIFALLFIIFTNLQSSGGTDHAFEFLLSLIILTGVLVVVISRIIMFYYTKKRTLTYWEYIIWVSGEIFYMSLFYTLYSYTLDETRDFWEVYRSSVTNTSLILLLPYIISLLFFSWQEKSRRVRELEEERNREEGGTAGEILSFRDEKGELQCP